MKSITIRPIEQRDNVALAIIIRKALEEFGANHPGTVYYDASTDALFELFQQNGAAYLVAEEDNVVLGGVGVFPTDGLPTGTGELVKMYLSPAARGKGLGKTLIEKIIQQSLDLGYQQLYLESMPELTKALVVYEKFGFQYLPAPLGNSGHSGCSKWMLKVISATA